MFKKYVIYIITAIAIFQNFIFALLIKDPKNITLISACFWIISFILIILFKKPNNITNRKKDLLKNIIIISLVYAIFFYLTRILIWL